MFRRILVANRGEIARRIIKTLNRMGIEAVAIYSRADSGAVYLKEASRSICIGGPRAQDSYLCPDAILEAAMLTQCEAIHPGFGFLSENAIFAQRCNQEKLTFIGPKPKHIAAMGDKAKARSMMSSLGVPTLVGSDGVVSDGTSAQALANEMGYPVLLKASAGGGGKGMRLVERPQDLPRLFGEAQLEAQSSFNDDKLYLEKFITGARHIEFQMLGDHYGKVVCLGERECSLQRRNQKLIEEAPANNFSDDKRRQAADIFVSALKSMGYVSAGTIECLMSDDDQLFFMEMNTRLQVEHPVTEMITGIDIVEWQVRIACNEQIDFSGDDVRLNGSAIECRINAEDVHDDFRPCPGVVDKVVWPTDQQEQIRIDTYLENGATIPAFYDSMVAKVIVHADNRQAALAMMEQALSQISIDGVSTTIDFHRSILRNKEFRDGYYDCSFIEKNMKKLLAQG